MKTPAAIEAEFTPRIAAAHAAEILRRDSAFAAAPFTIAEGIVIRAMSLADYLALRAAGNAHVTINPEPKLPQEREKFWAVQGGIFLWRLALDFTPHVAARAAFIERLAPVSFSQIHRGISDYLDETFADAPQPPSQSNEAPVTTDDPFRVSFAVHWLREVAELFPWPLTELMAMPLVQFFQFLRLARAEARIKRGKHPKPAHDAVDRLWAEMLRQMNAAMPAPSA